MRSKQVDRVFIFVLAVASIIAVLLVFNPEIYWAFNDKKSWEMTTQFVFVVVLGGAVAVVYRRWEDVRLEEKNRRKALEESYRATVQLHHDYKKIRRTLRAKSIIAESGPAIKEADFSKLMDQLEDCQLKAETMKREVSIQSHLFAEQNTLIEGSLRNIEKYLRRLLRSYESGGKVLQEDGSLVPLDEPLKCFLWDRYTVAGQPNVEDGLFKHADKLRDAVGALIK
jgi:hypothetical protein